MYRLLRRAPLLLLASSFLASLPAAAQTMGSAPVMAAASDLQFALEDAVARFKADAGADIRLSTGSSGNFARQIREGAPFQLFLSADEQFVFDLARDGFTKDSGALYAIGRIALIVPHGSPLKADGSLEDLKSALAHGRVRRFAIANPEHAPYGRRAEEALRRKGLWDAIRDKLVLGENVSQAAQFATTANAQGGIVAYSLVLSPRVATLGTHALIPDSWHEPLRQRMVLLKNAGPVAEHFYAYLQHPAGRSILRRHGFVLPGEPAS